MPKKRHLRPLLTAALLAALLAALPGGVPVRAEGRPSDGRYRAYVPDKDEELKTIYGILSCGALSCTIGRYFYSTATKGEKILSFCEVGEPCEVDAAVRGTTITYAYSAVMKPTNSMRLRVDDCRAFPGGGGVLQGQDMDANEAVTLFMAQDLYQAWCVGGHVRKGETRPVVYTLKAYVEGGEPRTAKIFVGFAKE